MPDPREIFERVAMSCLLDMLGIKVNERTRRGPCPIHGGSNPTAFSWTDTGLWKCHSCGAGGDRIALIRAIRHCGFHRAMEFLAAIAGVEYRPHRASQTEIDRVRLRRARAERAAWSIRDEIVRLRGYYLDGLHRTERLQRRIGDELFRVSDAKGRERGWDRIGRLAPVSAFFLAGFLYLGRMNSADLVRFALASPNKRRGMILGENRANAN